MTLMMTTKARNVLVLLLVLLVQLNEAFQVKQLVHTARGGPMCKMTTATTTKKTTSLSMGWFDFEPFGGGGSGKEKADKDEQWEAQQEILRLRRSGGVTKDSLKKKYDDKRASERAKRDAEATRQGSDD